MRSNLIGAAALLLAGCARPIIDLSAGLGTACLLRESGKLECEVINYSDDYDRDLEEDPPRGRGWTEVDIGVHQACVLDDGGYPTCWGRFLLPGEDGEDITVPADDVAPEEALYSLGVTNNSACALRRSDNTLLCWGNMAAYSEFAAILPTESLRRQETLERGVCFERTDGSIGCANIWEDFAGLVPSDYRNPVELDAEGGTLCATDSDGRISCWGRPEYNQNEPPAGTGFHSIAVGQKHVCALDADNEIACWGNGYFGQTSPPEGKYTRVVSGSHYSCATDERDKIVCWGCTEEGDPYNPPPGSYCVW